MSVSTQIPCSFYYYCSVVYREIREGDTSRSAFIVQVCFSYPGIFVLSYEVEKGSFKVCKELCWNFGGKCIESVDCF